jgi:hypothetical protein
MRNPEEGNLLFIGLSWEERCFLGLKVDYDKFNQTSKVIILYNCNSEGDDNENRIRIAEYCAKRKVQTSFVKLDYSNPILTWKKIEDIIEEHKEFIKKPVIDITTLPREITWMLFFFMRKYTARIYYLYHSPEKYSSDWLSKEPGAPRLLLKHSGISDLNKSTGIILLTGFDEVRTRKLVEYYEPKLVSLGIQSGSNFDNKERNSKDKHVQSIKGQTNVNTFQIDAFSGDHGYSTINQQIKLMGDYNVIACSQGPKLSLLSLYRSYLANTNIALCYLPSRQYNKDYSTGIGNTIKGDIEF